MSGVILSPTTEIPPHIPLSLLTHRRVQLHQITETTAMRLKLSWSPIRRGGASTPHCPPLLFPQTR
jgi:hypothetical protein